MCCDFCVEGSDGKENATDHRTTNAPSHSTASAAARPRHKNGRHYAAMPDNFAMLTRPPQESAALQRILQRELLLCVSSMSASSPSVFCAAAAPPSAPLSKTVHSVASLPEDFSGTSRPHVQQQQQQEDEEEENVSASLDTCTSFVRMQHALNARKLRELATNTCHMQTAHGTQAREGAAHGIHPDTHVEEEEQQQQAKATTSADESGRSRATPSQERPPPTTTTGRLLSSCSSLCISSTRAAAAAAEGVKSMRKEDFLSTLTQLITSHNDDMRRRSCGIARRATTARHETATEGGLVCRNHSPLMRGDGTDASAACQQSDDVPSATATTTTDWHKPARARHTRKPYACGDMVCLAMLLRSASRCWQDLIDCWLHKVKRATSTGKTTSCARAGFLLPSTHSLYTCLMDCLSTDETDKLARAMCRRGCGASTSAESERNQSALPVQGCLSVFADSVYCLLSQRRMSVPKYAQLMQRIHTITETTSAPPSCSFLACVSQERSEYNKARDTAPKASQHHREELLQSSSAGVGGSACSPAALEQQLDVLLRQGPTRACLQELLRAGVHPSLRRIVYCWALRLPVHVVDDSASPATSLSSSVLSCCPDDNNYNCTNKNKSSAAANAQNSSWMRRMSWQGAPAASGIRSTSKASRSKMKQGMPSSPSVCQGGLGLLSHLCGAAPESVRQLAHTTRSIPLADTDAKQTLPGCTLHAGLHRVGSCQDNSSGTNNDSSDACKCNYNSRKLTMHTVCSTSVRQGTRMSSSVRRASRGVHAVHRTGSAVPDKAELRTRQARAVADVARYCGNNPHYFIFDKELTLLAATLMVDDKVAQSLAYTLSKSKANSRDPTRNKHIADDEDAFYTMQPHAGSNRNSNASDSKECVGDRGCRIRTRPFVPLQGFSFWLAPLCYITVNAAEQYTLLREWTCQLWGRLHRGPQTELLPCCWLFETVVVRHVPQLYLQLTRVRGVSLVCHALHWMLTSFAELFPPTEVLVLWDIMLYFHVEEREIGDTCAESRDVSLSDWEGMPAKGSLPACFDAARRTRSSEKVPFALFMLPLLAASLVIFRAPLMSRCETAEEVMHVLRQPSEMGVRALLRFLQAQ